MDLIVTNVCLPEIISKNDNKHCLLFVINSCISVEIKKWFET